MTGVTGLTKAGLNRFALGTANDFTGPVQFGLTFTTAADGLLDKNGDRRLNWQEHFYRIVTPGQP